LITYPQRYILSENNPIKIDFYIIVGIYTPISVGVIPLPHSPPVKIANMGAQLGVKIFPEIFAF
jgi:hypothetical protein